MCTVTFLPLGKTDYILTSNRDESVERAPAIFPFRKSEILFPKDGQAGGTWIAAQSSGKAVCLLNGAFSKHKHDPPYRKSRGLIVLEAFTFSDFKTFTSKIKLNNIEPFTLVMVESKKDDLYEFRWDGHNKHFKSLESDRPHFWCSATLYSQETFEIRKEWFKNWVITYEHSMENILHFHHYGGDGDKINDLVINRNEFLKTLSICSIHYKMRHSYMVYIDLQKGTSFQEIV
jgi:uncharacterized protein with NRDE domain